ncbi:phospholipase C [Alicyclobacillus sp. SO9]|uniref:phospholipase C n=1 Tax=Alicyclobacillus sp. SO9 TaxID=2665646 RepID=UPI0018E80EC8|nr:alkaline phosphatase family protein [Alicyclobacillus sp. SO9]QQE79116.1 alkaline phosphatase family protein [Alicyclobacillus sp. SO9]
MNQAWRHLKQRPLAVVTGASAIASLLLMTTAGTVSASPFPEHVHAKTVTPIKHVVVIFDENISFDHYFGTYPHAKNPPGVPQFHAAPGTPTVNGLSGPLLTHNPNGVNPQRLNRSQEVTADMDHSYQAEQAAYDGGKVDKFVSSTGHGNKLVMDYYDGNTVTGLWNYAQHYAMNDNSFGTVMGPTLPGHLNLISGQTTGVKVYSSNSTTGKAVQLQPGEPGYPQGAIVNNTMVGNINPYFDKASTGKTAEMTGKNIGNLLNAKGVTWGWFIGGFRNTSETHKNYAGASVKDYAWPFTDPFQFYKSTSNPNHLPPSSPEMIGHTDQANHQYDLTDFWTAVASRNLPSVSFLKPPAGWSGHAGVSSPLDEQQWIVNTINGLQQSPQWKNTAVIINYDDSDGWYDHVMPPIVTNSHNPNRLGYGPRLPLLVISPYAKKNFVDNTLTDQTSITKFIENNWKLGRIGGTSMDSVAGTLDNMFNFSRPHERKLFLSPSTGEPENPYAAYGQFYTWLRSLYADAGVQMPRREVR